MPQNNQQNRLVDFINIDCESNYFNTREQIHLKNRRHFTDTLPATQLTGSNVVTGLFSRARIARDEVVNNSSAYLTSSTVTDPSGNSRKILSSQNDYYASSSIDTYKNGVEIIKESDWTAGLAKITAGTPGHLRDVTTFGIPSFSVSEDNYYKETDVFDPVRFIETGPESLTFPIITSDTNQAENYVLDGVIEPFPLRPVLGSFSINFPFEPRAFRGEFSSGNPNSTTANDQVVSIDYFLPDRQNRIPYLDAVDLVAVFNDAGIVSASVGPSVGYFILENNRVPAFEDVVYPRGSKPGNYGSDLLNVVNQMKSGGTTYVSDKQKSATCGFTYEGSDQGVDSISYGDTYYGTNRDNRRRKRTIVSLRDSESFISSDKQFDDTNSISFVSQVVEYPVMLPTSYSGSFMSSAVRSELYKSGSISVTRSISPGLYDSVLRDSILSSKKRMGTL